MDFRAGAGTAWTSTDGETWTAATLADRLLVWDVVYTGSRFVAVGSISLQAASRDVSLAAYNPSLASALSAVGAGVAFGVTDQGSQVWIAEPYQ